MIVIVAIRLSREDSYFVVALTLSTVLGAQLLAVAALASLAAGCGGGGRLSKNEFVVKVNTICGDADSAAACRGSQRHHMTAITLDELLSYTQTCLDVFLADAEAGAAKTAPSIDSCDIFNSPRVGPAACRVRLAGPVSLVCLVAALL